MKLTIKILLALLGLVAIATGVSYQLPKQCMAEKVMLVPASPDQVFIYLENPTEWERWSPWNKKYDPTMIQLLGGPLRGAGARITWNGDKIGSRQMILTDSKSPSRLEYEITQDRQLYKTTGTFELTATATGTRVHWRERTPLQDSPVDLVKGAWQQYVADKEMEEGLLGLKALVEQRSKRSATR